MADRAGTAAGGGRQGLRLPRLTPRRTPLTSIALRLGLALLLLLVNWGLVLLESDQYTDNADGHVSVIDALYYTTVTLSTTGYGDITPVTEQARLVNALVVTPMRLMFVIILVGTTLSALTERSRTEIRVHRWKARMRDHVVVLGYGTKGRNAVRALRLRHHPADRIVVVEADAAAAARASSDGYAVVIGSATHKSVLAEAQVERARTAIIALDRDDTAVLAALTLRRVAPHVTVLASSRESATAELLRESGAASVVVSSETAGRLLGLATDSPDAVSVVEDLLSFGSGLDLDERAVEPSEVGRPPHSCGVPVVGVWRGGRMLRYSDPSIGSLQPADRILYVASREDPQPPR
ncbi:voltage-gated potassium channel [Quadrisphaera granulorum]|uniref:Voltage-gated potassium channel n=1 Tax=Quadrisphaera granulorum TaxID=317664 RepID=A0A315ZZF2_9ACTN|nr:potassium channel protein [Quadrisphaera granulorum]PWJ50250.1 voltage-gated potassium channel [Quadrisphaera granulorum]SZE98016.1 voltage-gated potassium channel [Quadrisphaera granulorum]